jgi:hypothetical protein
MTRGMRQLIARWMILVLVLTQFAVSAYACPSYSQMGLTGQQPQTSSIAAVDDAMGMHGPKAATASDSSQSAMLNCDSMRGRLDAAAPNLCDACCHHDQQPDHASSLAAPALILNSLYAVPAAITAPIPARFDAPSSSDLAAAAPPRTVLHCCWQI